MIVSAMPYKLTEHTGEMELELSALTLAGVYEEAVVAVSREMMPKGAFGGDSPGPEHRNIEITARDNEALLVELLNEIVYLADSYNFACDAATVSEHDGGTLTCTLKGWVSDAVQSQVKAATYHRLKVEMKNDGWYARVVLDV